MQNARRNASQRTVGNASPKARKMRAEMRAASPNASQMRAKMRANIPWEFLKALCQSKPFAPKTTLVHTQNLVLIESICENLAVADGRTS